VGKGWRKLVERSYPVLLVHFLCRGVVNEYVERVLGCDLGCKKYLYLDKEVFMEEDNFEALQTKLVEKIEENGVGLLSEFAEKWREKTGELIALAQDVNESAETKTDAELADLFKKFANKNYEASTSMLLPLEIQEFLEKRIRGMLESRGEGNVEQKLAVLTAPEKVAENAREFEALLCLAAKTRAANLKLYDLNQETLDSIDGHIRGFGWINAGGFEGNPWTRKQIIERMRALKNDPQKALEEMREGKRANKEEAEKLMKKLGLNYEEETIIKITKEYLFIKTMRMNAFMKANFIARPFLSEIASRTHIGFFDLVYLTPEEITDYLEKRTEPDKKKLEERKRGYGVLILENEARTFEGRDLQNFKKQFLVEEGSRQVQELKGKTAFKGVKKGIVKIVKGISDLAKVRQGDVMVTPMTEPKFVPAMERAAAFVTDEGGILCHAAIVAREMSKPCVTATKNATKVLKDGDLVEVDANNGVVRILERA